MIFPHWQLIDSQCSIVLPPYSFVDNWSPLRSPWTMRFPKNSYPPPPPLLFVPNKNYSASLKKFCYSFLLPIVGSYSPINRWHRKRTNSAARTEKKTLSLMSSDSLGVFSEQFWCVLQQTMFKRENSKFPPDYNTPGGRLISNIIWKEFIPNSRHSAISNTVMWPPWLANQNAFQNNSDPKETHACSATSNTDYSAFRLIGSFHNALQSFNCKLKDIIIIVVLIMKQDIYDVGWKIFKMPSSSLTFRKIHQFCLIIKCN